MIINRTTRQITRFARVTGSGGPEGSRQITLGDLEGFVTAAKSEGIPLDTVVTAPRAAVFGSDAPVHGLQVEATVEEGEV